MLSTVNSEITKDLRPSEVPREINALLLDDSNFDRARIRRLSQKTKLGIHLDEVDSIAALDRAVKETPYDLILIDYRLPVGDGLEALDHVLQTDLNRGAGKIMITGNSAVETAVTAMRGGCHDFIDKNEMDVETFRQAVLTALSTARAGQVAQADPLEDSDRIRAGVLAALHDDSLRENVVSLFRQEFKTAFANQTYPNALSGLEQADMELLLSGLSDEDEFRFH